MDPKKILVFLVSIAMLSVAFSGCTNSQNEVLNVYHAGSLSIPFDELEDKFEEEHPDVDVRLQGAGSVDTVKKVTERGQKADVVAVADHTLIPDLMYEEEKADWMARFARNRIVMAYTEQSNYRDEINSENWYEILDEEDVKFGFSDPNADPCGYRSQMVTLLAEDHYQNDTIFENLIGSNTAIEAEGKNITVPQDLDFNSDKVMVRSAEVDLMSALEAGEIDYLYIYQSVAEQHEGVEFVELPTEIDLSSVEHSDDYGEVSLTRASGEKVKGKPIVYGITIPKTVQNRELAVEFVKLLLDEEGQQIMNDNGQPPIDPPMTDDREAMPEDLKGFVEEGST